MACGCVVEERTALMRIKSSMTMGPEIFPDAPPNSWGRDDNCCSWEGVTCNNSTRVSALFSLPCSAASPASPSPAQPPPLRRRRRHGRPASSPFLLFPPPFSFLCSRRPGLCARRPWLGRRPVCRRPGRLCRRRRRPGHAPGADARPLPPPPPPPTPAPPLSSPDLGPTGSDLGPMGLDPAGLHPTDLGQAGLGSAGVLHPTAPPPGPSVAQIALAEAFQAVRAEAAAAEERVRTAALTWERERTTAETLARQVAEAERTLVAAGKQPVVQSADSGGSSSHQASPIGSTPRPTVPDPLAAHLHLQAVGVQNIRSLVSVVLDTTSTSYARWREQVLLALTRYALASHVLVDTPEDARDVTWIRLDAIALSWIRGTLSLDLQDLVRTHGDTARHAWWALEGHFYGNAESRSARLDAAFRTFVQGDLTITQYCQHMKKMAEELTALGCPVSDRNLVIQVLRGLNPCYDVLKVWLPRQSPFPSFMKVWEDLLDDKVSRGLTPGSSSSSSPPSALAGTSVLAGVGAVVVVEVVVLEAVAVGVMAVVEAAVVVVVVAVVAVLVAAEVGAVVVVTHRHPRLPHHLRLLLWELPLDRTHLHVAPAAMFAAPSPFSWTPPGPPTATPWPSPAQAWAPPAPTWPGGWDATALAQSFSTVGLTPPVTAEWVADTGASHHTTPDAGILSSVHPPHPSLPSSIMVGDGSCLPRGSALYPSPACFHHIKFGSHLFRCPCVDSLLYYLAPQTWPSRPRSKSETFPTLLHFFAWVSTQFGLTIKAVQCDNGREFDNNTSRAFFLSQGVQLRMSCPYTSAQNGKAERMIRTTNDVLRTLLLQASLPARFWAEALHTATYLLNRLPSSACPAPTPHHALFGTPPRYDHLRVFGCACYPNTSSTAPHKLAPRSTLCVFLGYSPDHKGYRCFDLSSRRVIISRHVVFDESVFPYSTSQPSSADPELEALVFTDPVESPPFSVYPLSAGFPAPRAAPASTPAPRAAPVPPPAPRTAPAPPPAPRSARFAQPIRVYQRRPVVAPELPPSDLPAPSPPPVRARALSRLDPDVYHPPVIHRDPDHTHPMVTRRAAGVLRPAALSASEMEPGISPVPSSVREALADPYWRQAMEEEYAALLANQTWDLVPRPSDCNVVTGKWIWTHKRRADGTLERYKARWVLRGFTQRPGVYYDETFSPVVKPATVRTVLSIALSQSWPVHQLDVNNAFLHGTLSETVYCSQPAGFVDSTRPDLVCRLNKSLYGLKQAPRAWYSRFASFLVSLGFTECKSDTSLFVYRHGSETSYLLRYVDDIILVASSQALLQRIMQSLQQEFAMKDLGVLHHFLGVTVESRPSGLFLHQRQYALEILERAGMSDCKPCSTPVDTLAKLSAAEGAPVADRTAYQSIAGALLYLTFTRPDITYAVQQPHLNAMKRLLRYLRGTADYGLALHRSPVSELIVYTDADWAGCPDTRRSTSGYAVFLGGNLVSWSSKRQPVVSRSSAEAEYRAVANGVAEASWLRQLLGELHCPLTKSTLVYCDNVSAVYLSSNPVQHQRTKHVEIDLHFVRDRVAVGQVRVLHVPTTSQFADIFTMGLPSSTFTELRGV
ncbi:hypothetical protein HU200_039863 [Digitaria exilis]|uniref:Integrase catalytic domain-containing protein n=1 Tax=Digitaria exilis TaxID=1010633 RepID=A0A835EF70_9POAL|nr:hypothetical protein HU200_039863 [Digitaria exilis]